MDLNRMLSIIQEHSDRKLNPEQEAVVKHGAGPLWVIAGPGSGKTFALVLRCLKLICVDSLPEKSIILTTFTRKAAKKIQDDLAIYKSYIDQDEPSLRSIDVFKIRIGTLHSLCNDIMQEYRYTGYQNYRLLEGETDQLLFVYDHSELAASSPRRNTHLHLWRHFDYLVSRYSRITGYRWSRNSNYLPNRWLRANATVTLFNRIVEDRIDINQMREQGGVWQTLADCYDAYQNNLESNLCCDFAHLQMKFLGFLESTNGKRFLEGDGSKEHPGISHVLVDEYQDTNPIQEEIYLELAKNEPHNLCVVGDDDQALYRFRGGTVECMVNFDRACRRKWGQNIQVKRQPLITNYRSHPDIINWCDNYILSFDVMNEAGARVINKPSIVNDPNWLPSRQTREIILGSYPSVTFMVGQGQSRGKRQRSRETEQNVAEQFADLVQQLLNNGIVHDLSQCVLLLKSVQEWSAGPYQRALEERGIPVYNPRARTFLQQEEVQTALGTLITILDPNHQGRRNQVRSRGIQQTIQNWIDEYNRIAQNHPDLSNYVSQAISRISQVPTDETITQMSSQGSTTIPATIQEIFYHIISFEPFMTWRQDPERTVRLGVLSKVLESYSSVPFQGYKGSTRGTLRTGSSTAGQVHTGQLNHFYYSLIVY